MAKCQIGDDNRYIPAGLIPIGTEGSSSIDAAIDNFDQNEETLDGKSTTHSMAAVIYQRNTTHVPSIRIPRVTSKTLKENDGIDESNLIERYRKPPNRPEPPVVPTTVSINIDKYLDLLWCLARYISKQNEIPLVDSI